MGIELVVNKKLKHRAHFVKGDTTRDYKNYAVHETHQTVNFQHFKFKYSVCSRTHLAEN